MLASQGVPEESSRTGRPSDYTPDTAARICELLSEGESLRSICEMEGMPPTGTVKRWLRAEADFRAQYAQAREDQTDHFLELISEIADDTSNDTVATDKGESGNPVAVSRAKLRIDTLKWRMAKQAPKKYGDRATLDVNVATKPRELSDDELARIIEGEQ